MMKYALKVIIIIIVVAVLLATLSCTMVVGDTPEETLQAKHERLRNLEIEISELESRLKKAEADSVTISRKLEQIESSIITSYMRIDKVEQQLDEAKRKFNKRVRILYKDGRVSDLVKLLESDDVSDFITKYDAMVSIAGEDAVALEEIRDKKEMLDEQQRQLLEYKRQAYETMRKDDVRAIEMNLAQKRDELTELHRDLIAIDVQGQGMPGNISFQPRRTYYDPSSDNFIHTGKVFEGYSSWYGNEFHGRGTANGEIFDQYALTCAHRTLPFGTWLEVSFKGRSIIVRVNDRGPFIEGRILDLSRGAAESIGLTGVQWVQCEIVIPES